MSNNKFNFKNSKFKSSISDVAHSSNTTFVGKLQNDRNLHGEQV